MPLKKIKSTIKMEWDTMGYHNLFLLAFPLNFFIKASRFLFKLYFKLQLMDV